MTNQVMTQKEAVYQAVTTILEENGIKFEDGQDARAVLTTEFRAQVKEILVQSFMAGAIELDVTKRGDEKYIKSYVPGLITNHLNKDKRLNGNTKYETKNPGSRFGSGDDQLKALKALRTTLTASNASAQEIAEIDEHIDIRVKALQANKPVKVKTVKVNFADLPADLQAKYSNNEAQ